MYGFVMDRRSFLKLGFAIDGLCSKGRSEPFFNNCIYSLVYIKILNIPHDTQQLVLYIDPVLQKESNKSWLVKGVGK